VAHPPFHLLPTYLSCAYIFQHGVLSYEGCLLELQQDGAQTRNVLGILGVLGVELAETGNLLPSLPRDLLVTVLDERLFRCPTKYTKGKSMNI
jgi:hypothetical protein